MHKKKIWILSLLMVGVFYVLPAYTYAHEVYVLNNDETARDKALPPLNIFKAAVQNEHTFLLILLLGILLLVCVLGISLSHKIEGRLDPLLLKIKPYASYVAQLTLGAALIAAAHFGSLFGPELPFSALFGSMAHIVAIALYVAGICVIVGLHARFGALIAIFIFISAIPHVGVYIISYLTYVGEALLIMLFGAGYGIAKSSIKLPEWIRSHVEKRKYFILRMFFAMSLIYAAFYAKLIHGQLALDTVTKYNLTNYFHFSPLFVVLGAFLVELTIGLFFLIGFELRFTSLLFLGFLTASLIFFGEAVWPHLILIGTSLAVFVHGYDEFTIERRWYRKGKTEPVL